MAHRYATSPDGTRLALHEYGDAAGPVIVAVHGFPDNHTVWDGVAAELGDRFRVVAYDVRGAGESDKPRGRRAYHQDRLTEDLIAVLDEVGAEGDAGEPVHLLAHDWGSMQLWTPLADPRLAGRVASFVSISGPSLDYAALWLRGRGHAGATARQVLASTYMFVFQVPWLPEQLAKAGVISRGAAKVGGGDVHRGLAETTNGINLYRANVLRSLFRPRPPRITVPTLVLVPLGDAFSSVPVASQAPAGHVADLTVTPIDGGHWVVSEHPERIAGPVADFVAAHTAAAQREARG